jgi:hypothetical protein
LAATIALAQRPSGTATWLTLTLHLQALLTSKKTTTWWWRVVVPLLVLMTSTDSKMVAAMAALDFLEKV